MVILALYLETDYLIHLIGSNFIFITVALGEEFMGYKSMRHILPDAPGWKKLYIYPVLILLEIVLYYL